MIDQGAPQDVWTRLCRWAGWRTPARPAVRLKPAAVPRPDWRATIRRRAIVAGAIFAAWTAGIEARLIYLQVVQHEELVARAERQQLRTIAAPAKRGEILDRHGRVLAYSVDADSIYAVPSDISDPDETAAALCDALERCTDREREVIAGRLRRQRAFAYVRRQVSPDEARRVAALGLDAVGFLKETRRYYPKKELAAHVLGYVGIDSNGLHGVEATHDTQIRGRPGKVLIQTDARRHAFSRLERPPTAGATLELTIDEYLQHIAERELREAVERHDAAGGSVVVMDPTSGEILALANEPTFNPNTFQRASEISRRNRGIQDLYEPGSTFKIVTASAALEEEVVDPDDPIDVTGGMIRFGARRIYDTHRYGILSFTDVIVKSSNVGAIKVGLQLGPERLGRYVYRFGFGRPISRDFQGENPGIVWNPAGWNDSALASVAMGYQVGVTPLQMASAVSSVANGGELLEPRIVRAIIDDGRRVVMSPRVIRRTISSETAATLTSMMEEVVERGTARAARVPGYAVAGKTGTAAKLVDGRYSKSEYNASFVGFAPARQPALAILVVIDSPRTGGHYGGAIAAPVFQRITEASLRHLGVPPSYGRVPPVLVARHETSVRGAVPTPVRGPIEPPRRTAPVVDADYMPDLIGLSAREALRALGRIGLGSQIEGDGVVVHQDPPVGAPIEPGSPAMLRLSRVAPSPDVMP